MYGWYTKSSTASTKQIQVSQQVPVRNMETKNWHSTPRSAGDVLTVTSKIQSSTGCLSLYHVADTNMNKS